MGFHALGLGFINKKTIENGNGTKIRARQALRQWDLCSGTMGFSHNLGWEMGIGSPLQDPLFYDCFFENYELLVNKGIGRVY